MILSVSYRITGNIADSEDILQDTILEYEKRKPNGNIKAWLIKVATNKSINLVKNNSRAYELQFEEESPEDSLIKKEMQEVVKRAIMKLDPKERAIVTLKKFENLSHKDIASILNITEENSRIILMRTLEKLKDYLEPYIGGSNGRKNI